jgi:hypothetical protein
LFLTNGKDKFKVGAKLISDNCYVFDPEWFLFLYFKYWYFHLLKRFWDCDFNFVKVLELHPLYSAAGYFLCIKDKKCVIP